jgi:hypothetical protein
MIRTIAVLVILAALPQEKPPKSYRLPSTDLKQRVIWGSTLEVPDGPSLAFGGQDQKGEDGNPHTRIKVDGQWTSIHEELKKNNPLEEAWGELQAKAYLQHIVTPRIRSLFFDGLPADPNIARNIVSVSAKELAQGHGTGLPAAEAALVQRALRLLKDLPEAETPQQALRAKLALQQAADLLGAEPAARGLSPLAYDAKTKLFVLFGGDHLDYLSNETWVFDPAKRKWSLRSPKEAPPPRANHQLQAADGKVTLTGGYTYTSSTDYVGGQYRDQGDGEWTYDIAADTWTGGKAVSSDLRVYRTGRLHPDYYTEGPLPDAAAFASTLAALPANTWVNTKTPRLPALNRDWGTAVLDPDLNLILRWSGGHSAHGGSDVLQYHIATNRWELTMPVEFPLGQLYTNTEYPDGWNFNRRPWVTGHTYQSYGYDPNLKKMLFTGRRDHCYVYDPGIGDWTSRFAKPKDMVYGDCYYTLTITSTPTGLVCWTQQGKLFRFNRTDWVEIPLKGAKLPGSVVDNSTVVYDSKRDRLLFARKQYGDKTEYDGVLQVVDLKSGEVSVLAPEGKEKAVGVSYLCQLRYDSTNDLVLGGCTLPPDGDGFRRTPAYDCAGNRWVSLKIGGDDPSGKKGRNVSLGLMYDAARKLFWAVDTNSNVYVLRLDVASADLRPL